MTIIIDADAMTDTDKTAKNTSHNRSADEAKAEASATISSDGQPPAERGGPKGPEPTRFGDWEANGRCTDF